MAHLSEEAKNEMTLRAVKGESCYKLGIEYGVANQYAYRLRNEAIEEARENVTKAEAELVFRQQVLEIAEQREAGVYDPLTGSGLVASRTFAEK